MAEPAARRTLVHLILTLNHAYPDYDFGALRAHHFKKEPGPASVEDAVDAHLLGVARVWDATPGYGGADTPFLEALWGAIDSAAGLGECDVYSYKSDGEADPFGELCGRDGGCWFSTRPSFFNQPPPHPHSTAEDGAVWSFNFFFYNRRSKRVVYFACRGLARGGGGDGGPGGRGGGRVAGDSSDDAYNSDSADDGDAADRRRREPYGLAGEFDDLG